MKVKIYPGFASGEIKIPPSKSLLHRAIISASLAKGTSTISNIILSDDIKATINAFKQFGVNIKANNNKLEISNNKPLTHSSLKTIDCNESGSTLRFLIPILANNKGIKFTGNPTLMKRPLTIYQSIFKANNNEFTFQNKTLFIKGDFKSGNYKIPGNISSQFISGLLFALPLKKNDSQITITDNFESKAYVDMTIKMLDKFNIKITKKNNTFFIKGNQEYQANNIEIDSDFSQLAFFAVAGIINGDIKISNIPANSLQPDKTIIDLIKQMNGNIAYNNQAYYFKKSETKGINIDVSQNPDIAPILSILAGLSKGKTNILNAKRLKIKETNRLFASYDVLTKLGVNVKMGNDSLSIIGQSEFYGSIFDSYNDHRMVMSLAIATLRNIHPITINNAEAVNKSYPNFFEDLQSLGIKIEYI